MNRHNIPHTYSGAPPSPIPYRPLIDESSEDEAELGGGGDGDTQPLLEPEAGADANLGLGGRDAAIIGIAVILAGKHCFY